MGRDPEIQVCRPPQLGTMLLDFFYLISGTTEIVKTLRHACGLISPDVAAYVPSMERRKMIMISGLYVALIAAMIGWCFVIHSIMPLMFVWTPRFYCGWFHQTLGLTQHAGMAVKVTRC